MKKTISILALFLIGLSSYSQLKTGVSPKVISNNVYFEVESVNGSKTVITKDSGNMGIGINTPTHKLHIVSDSNPIRVVGLMGGSTNDSVLTINPLNGVFRRISSISLGAASEPWFNTATNSGATSNTQNIYQMGNVGIGNSNPLSRLVVGAGSGYEELNVRSGGASNASLKLSATGAKGREYAIFSTGTGDGSGAGNLNFFDLNKNTSRILVDTNGYIGINTTQPKNRMEISHGTGGNSGLRFTNLNSSNTPKSASSVNQKYLSVDGNGDVVLANIADEVINVIGLASGLISPVMASTFQSGTFENNYTATDSTVIYVNQTDGTQWIYTANNGGQYKSYIAPAATEWYLAGGTVDAGSNKTGAIYRTGNVGIGNQNPQSRLVVGSGTGYEELNIRSGGASNAALKMSAIGVDGREYSVYSTGTDDGSGAGNFAIYDNNANLNRVLINKNGNVGMGDLNTIDTSAQLEVKSASKGFLPPRMNKTQRDAIVNPASGLIVYCTNCNNGSGCLQVNDGTPADPSWSCLGTAAAPNVIANCDGFSTGNFFNGVALSGASYKVTVTNNSFTNVTMAFQSTDITLSGVSGMTVGAPTGVPALSAGSITLVAGQAVVLTYPITGTPSTAGTLNGIFTKLALNCTKTKQVNNTAPNFNCNGINISPNNYNLVNGSSYSGTITIPYTVTGGSSFPAEIITSNGLSFTRNAGTYTAPSGTITYSISGTYTGTSNSTFNITLDANAGGCSLTIFDAIRAGLAVGGCTSCAAYDAAAVNSWVLITANEYNSLPTTVTGTNKNGLINETYFSNTTSGSYNASRTYSQPIGGSNHSQVPASNFIYAFKHRTGTSKPTNLSGMQVKYNALAQTGTYQNLNGTLPAVATPTLNTNYHYVLKRPTLQTASSATYFGIYTTQSYQVMSIPLSPVTIKFESGANASTLTGTDAAQTLPIQSLSAPTKRW